MTAPTPSPDEGAQNLDADLVIANLSDRVGRDARTIAMLQAALAAKSQECDELRAELVKATGGGETEAADAAKPAGKAGPGAAGGRASGGR